MQNSEKLNALFCRAVKHNLVPEQKSSHLITQVGAFFSEFGFDRVQIAFRADGIEKPHRHIETLTLLCKVAANALEVFSRKQRASNAGHYLQRPFASNSDLMASMSRGSQSPFSASSMAA